MSKIIYEYPQLVIVIFHNWTPDVCYFKYAFL